MDQIATKYAQLEPTLARLNEEVRFILNESIRQSGIKIHSLVSRIKAIDSISTKITRKGLLGGFDDLDDLVGLRVVCLFRSDIEKIGRLIRQEFDVLEEDNKLNGANVEVFGYQSVHFVTKIKSSYSGPRYQGLHSSRFEIQLRTVAMDTWATLSHYLDYKSEPDVPKNLRKDFFALSGLFYLADTHFEIFYGARQEASHVARMEARIIPTPTQEINLDSLTAYLVKRYTDRQHAVPRDVSELLSELSRVGYTDLAKLHSVLEASRDTFAEYEALSRPSGEGKFSDVGVVRISLGLADSAFAELRGYTKSPAMKRLGEKFRKSRSALS